MLVNRLCSCHYNVIIELKYYLTSFRGNLMTKTIIGNCENKAKIEIKAAELEHFTL